MKHQVYLLSFITCILLVNAFKYFPNRKFPLLPMNYYTSERLSSTLLAHISKDFGAKMPMSQIISVFERECKDFNFYQNLREAVEKFDKGRKYFQKVERAEIKMKIEKHTGKIRTEKNKLNNTLLKQTFEKILFDMLQCHFISEKMEIAIKIILRRLQISKLGSLRKISNVLQKIAEALNNNKVNRVNKLELKLIDENQIDKLNMQMVEKISKYLGKFLKNEVDMIKRETENFLISRSHKIE
jgi:hypothetical protein